VQKCPRCDSGRIKKGYKDVPLLSRLAGQCELLCTNCNLEFSGFAVIGLVGREKVWDPEDMTNRRSTPRYKANLPVLIEMVAEFSAEIRATRGHTIQVGRNGMSLRYLSSYTYQMETDAARRKLKLTLTLPQGVVTTYVEVVYFEPLTHEKATTQVLGARIIQSSPSDARRYATFINSFRLRTMTQRPKPELRGRSSAY
jgi:hypothetical protein